MGAIAIHPNIAVLSKTILYALRPLLVLGLDWIRFTIGFRFDADPMKSLWPGIGAVIYPILRKIEGGPEFVVVRLGSISFAAGLASYLRLSPVGVCFIARAILVNLPAARSSRFAKLWNIWSAPSTFYF